MSWLLWIGGGIVALCVAVVAIGWALPADHVARVESVVADSPDNVAHRIRNVRNYGAWREVTIEVLSEEPGRVRYRETSGGDTMTIELGEARGGWRFTTTILDQDLPFDGSWTIDLTPEGEGTRVVIEERGRVKNPVFRFLSHFVFGHTSTMETYLAALAAASG